MPTIDLAPRYELRVIPIEHEAWARAVCCHSFVHKSRLWAEKYSDEEKTPYTYASFVAAEGICVHQSRSGRSLGIYDKEYVLKRPESVATGGKLYWDLEDTTATREQLVEQMDFPLVHVAAAYDQFDSPTQEVFFATILALAPSPLAFQTLIERDTRDPKEWTATAMKQVFMRFSTATRDGYEGQGLMKKTAHYMMRQSAEDGFRGINIECYSETVDHVWSNPPEPFKGRLISEFETADYRYTDEDGKSSPSTL